MNSARALAWLISFAFGLAITFGFSVQSFAEDEYDEQTIAEVNEHFRTGAQLYYDEDYDAAIAEFEAAHAKIPNAVFLYNISLAYARKGETEKALETATQAQEFGGLGEAEKQQNAARIVALERSLNAREASVDIATANPPVEPLLNFGPAGWVGSALVVGAILGYGGVLIIDRSLRGDVEAYREAAERGDNVTYEDLRDDIRPRQTTGRVLFVLSSLALASGATLLVYDLLIDDKSTAVSIVPLPGGAGVSVFGRF